jgi:histidinol-phosphate aminotransferase
MLNILKIVKGYYTITLNLNHIACEMLIEKLNHWINPRIRALTLYQVHDATGFVKLDAMENPYTLPSELRQEWLELIQQVPFNRYPDPQAFKLKARLTTSLNLPTKTELLLGNGSDELLQILMLAVNGDNRVILSFEPSFVMYRMIATWIGLEFIGIPLQLPNFNINIDAALEAIARYRPAIIFLAYPNNPTGNLFDAAAIHRIIQAAPGLVIIDEAYAPFTDETWIEKILQYDNLLVLRTVSKMGLAGLRLGYLIGHPAWIKELDKIRMPYNINVLTQITVDWALSHKEIFDMQTRQIRMERERLQQNLSDLPGITVYPSQANFILFRVNNAPLIFQQLKTYGILIKNLHNSHPMLDNCLRVTVGTETENAAFLNALSTIANTTN